MATGTQHSVQLARRYPHFVAVDLAVRRVGRLSLAIVRGRERRLAYADDAVPLAGTGHEKFAQLAATAAAVLELALPDRTDAPVVWHVDRWVFDAVAFAWNPQAWIDYPGGGRRTAPLGLRPDLCPWLTHAARPELDTYDGRVRVRQEVTLSLAGGQLHFCPEHVEPPYAPAYGGPVPPYRTLRDASGDVVEPAERWFVVVEKLDPFAGVPAERHSREDLTWLAAVTPGVPLVLRCDPPAGTVWARFPTLYVVDRAAHPLPDDLRHGG